MKLEDGSLQQLPAGSESPLHRSPKQKPTHSWIQLQIERPHRAPNPWEVNGRVPVQTPEMSSPCARSARERRRLIGRNVLPKPSHKALAFLLGWSRDCASQATWLTRTCRREPCKRWSSQIQGAELCTLTRGPGHSHHPRAR